MDAESPAQTLRRADRLRTSREFQHVSRRGSRASSGRFVVLAAPRGVGEGSRIGLTVGRRVGNAVARNRVKRRVREWFRQGAMRGAAAFDWVVIARPGAAQLESQELRAELDELCGQAMTRSSR